MKRPLGWVLLALLAAAGIAVAQEKPAPLPADVVDFIARTNGCAHFAGEDAYDDARAEALTQAMQDLKCSELTQDAETLEQKYLCSQNPPSGFYCSPPPTPSAPQP